MLATATSFPLREKGRLEANLRAMRPGPMMPQRKGAKLFLPEGIGVEDDSVYFFLAQVGKAGHGPLANPDVCLHF